MRKHTALITLAIATGLLSHSSFGVQSFDEWRAARDARFAEYKDAYLERRQQYLQRVEENWGGATLLSNQTTLVQYSEDMQRRVILDYENATINLEYIDGSEPTTSDLNTMLRELSEISVAQYAADDPVLSLDSINDSRSLLTTFYGTEVSDFALESATIQHSVTSARQPTESEDPALDYATNLPAKRIATMSLQLDQHALSIRRAAPYVAHARQLGEQFQIDPALILAVAQVESSFNPLAQSHIPAFGLMQIVPHSAGLDVNRRLNQINAEPSAEELFEPLTNMHFGIGYLSLLDTTYLAAIHDPHNRLLCTIAAYNTGAGNVARVFHPEGRRQLSAAVSVINQMNPEEVEASLLSNLPYQETRDYLPKVLAAYRVHHEHLLATETVAP